MYFVMVVSFQNGTVSTSVTMWLEEQFVEGRHFQQSDAALNWYGCVAGILCMVGSYFLNRLLVKLS
ncbi:MAG: hypothetical protein K2M70_11775 [Lachnospiraceae bacterium]|nr:hypothetical protein [Lachnospiraceae bacterium]